MHMPQGFFENFRKPSGSLTECKVRQAQEGEVRTIIPSVCLNGSRKACGEHKVNVQLKVRHPLNLMVAVVDGGPEPTGNMSNQLVPIPSYCSGRQKQSRQCSPANHRFDGRVLHGGLPTHWCFLPCGFLADSQLHLLYRSVKPCNSFTCCSMLSPQSPEIRSARKVCSDCLSISYAIMPKTPVSVKITCLIIALVRGNFRNKQWTGPGTNKRLDFQPQV